MFNIYKFGFYFYFLSQKRYVGYILFNSDHQNKTIHNYPFSQIQMSLIVVREFNAS